MSNFDFAANAYRPILPPSSSSGYSTDSDVLEDSARDARLDAADEHAAPGMLPKRTATVVDWARSVHQEATGINVRSLASVREFEVHTQKFVHTVAAWADSQATRQAQDEAWRHSITESLETMSCDFRSTAQSVQELQSQFGHLRNEMALIQQTQAQNTQLLRVLLQKMEVVNRQQTIIVSSQTTKADTTARLEDEQDDDVGNATLLGIGDKEAYDSDYEAHDSRRRLLPSSPGSLEFEYES